MPENVFDEPTETSAIPVIGAEPGKVVLGKTFVPQKIISRNVY